MFLSRKYTSYPEVMGSPNPPPAWSINDSEKKKVASITDGFQGIGMTLGTLDTKSLQDKEVEIVEEIMKYRIDILEDVRS